MSLPLSWKDELGAHNLGRIFEAAGFKVRLIIHRRALLVEDPCAKWRQLDARVASLDRAFAGMAKEDYTARRLATIPEVGVINATAPVAVVGDARSFFRGRPFDPAAEAPNFGGGLCLRVVKGRWPDGRVAGRSRP